MKTILLTAIFSLVLISLKAQFAINAGNDTIVCEGSNIILGGSPTANGGTPSYTYKWETSYTIGSNTFYASTFLNDTTIPNPLLITQLSNLEILTFKLTVTDSLLNVAIDSVTITFSNFFTLLADNFATINQGDSVQLIHSYGGGIPPLSFEWTPNYNLSDANIENPWAKPDSTTYYICTVTDSVGCQASNGDIFEVYVNPVSVQEIINFNNNLFIYPNPTKNLLNIVVPDAQVLKIDIYSIDGKLIERKNINKNTAIDVSKYQTGLYFINATNSKGEVFRNKFVKE